MLDGLMEEMLRIRKLGRMIDMQFKNLFSLLSVLIALLLFVNPINAKATKTIPFVYEISNDGISITDTCLKTINSIPQEIDGYAITKLSERAFFACKNANRTIEIPETVTIIERECFLGVIGDGFIDYILPSSVVSIGEYALGYTCYEDQSDGCIIYDRIEKLSGVTIHGFPGTIAETYAKVNGFTFISIEDDIASGDVNDDGSFGVSDVVLFQKWLLAIPDATLENWKAADYNNDNIFNVFDLCLMKRALIEKNQTDDE